MRGTDQYNNNITPLLWLPLQPTLLLPPPAIFTPDLGTPPARESPNDIRSGPGWSGGLEWSKGLKTTAGGELTIIGLHQRNLAERRREWRERRQIIFQTKKSAEEVSPVVSSGGSPSPRPLGTCCSSVRDQTDTNNIRILSSPQ